MGDSAFAGRERAAGSVPALIAGDQFVRNSLLRNALHAEAGDRLLLREIELGWPIEPFGPVAEVQEAAGSEEEMLAALDGIEIVVTEMAPLTRRVIAASEPLRLIVVCRGGPVNVNLDAATERGIPVCYSPARNAAATAEYTIGLMLAAMRWIVEGHWDLSGGTWRGDFYSYDKAGTELEGKTVGLVGFGAVGSRVARVLRAFDAAVLVADPYVDSATVEAAGASAVSLDELLPRANVLSLHARLTPETQHLIGREEIARLPDGAVVVNAARGGLLDQDALCDALESGKLRGAALDVYDPEPPAPGSRVFSAPNLVLSPHLAGASRESAERAAVIAAAEVGRHLRGEPLRFVANFAVAAARGN